MSLGQRFRDAPLEISASLSWPVPSPPPLAPTDDAAGCLCVEPSLAVNTLVVRLRFGQLRGLDCFGLFFRGMFRSLLPSLLGWGTSATPVLRKGSGDIHMSLAASATDIDGVVRLAAAARIADGTGPASRNDLFLTPLSGFYTPATGDFVMIASNQASGVVVVDTDGACPAEGCSFDQAASAAVKAGIAFAKPSPSPSPKPTEGNSSVSAQPQAAKTGSTAAGGGRQLLGSIRPATSRRASPAAMLQTSAAHAGPAPGIASAALAPLASGPTPVRALAAEGSVDSAASGRSLAAGANPFATLLRIPANIATTRCTVIMRGLALPVDVVKARSSSRGVASVASASISDGTAKSGGGSSTSTSGSSTGGRRLGAADPDGPALSGEASAGDGLAHHVAEAEAWQSRPWLWRVVTVVAERLATPLAGERLDRDDAESAATPSGSGGQGLAEAIAVSPVLMQDGARPVGVAPASTVQASAGMLVSQEPPSSSPSAARPHAVASPDSIREAPMAGVWALHRATEAIAASAAALPPTTEDRSADAVPANAGRELTPRGPAPAQSAAGRPGRLLSSAAVADGTSQSGASEQAADSAMMRAFAQSMGLDAAFRAPGAQHVGRYMAPGRTEHGPVVLVLEGTITSPDCGFAANFTTASVVLNKDAALLSGAVYAFVMSILAILHFAGTVRAILDGLSAQVAASRSSVAAVAIGAATDAWLAIAHGGLALVVEDVSTGFGLVAIVLLLCFSVLEVRLMLTILKAQEPGAFDNMDAIRRVISRLYGRFYAGLFATVAIAFLLPSAWPFLLFIATSLWVPQIVHSARLGAPHGMRTSYVVVSTLIRVFPMLYVLGCPVSFLVELGLDAFQPTLAAAIAAWVSLQLVVLVMQQSFGAQFLVPTALLPEKYDYFRPVLVRDGRVSQADDDNDDNDDGAGAPAARPEHGGPAPGADGAAGAPPAGERTRLGAAWDAAVRSVRRTRRRFRRFPVWRFGPAQRPYQALPSTEAVGDVEAAAAAGAAVPGRAGTERPRDIEAGLGLGARLAPDIVPAAPPAEGAPPAGDDADPARSPDCVVCMAPVELPAAPGTYMVTPCGHIFHADCLRQWFNVKMQCPTCRAPVPEP